MTRESKFWGLLKAQLSKDKLDAYRIETGATFRGFPDLVVIGEGYVGFVELKVGTNQMTEKQKEFARKCSRRNVSSVLLRYKPPYIECWDPSSGRFVFSCYIEQVWECLDAYFRRFVSERRSAESDSTKD